VKLFISTIKHYIFLTFLALVLMLNTSSAQQNKDYFFQKLTTLNGLSSNYIQSIFRDSRGYVWIGTNYGLNRYDGKRIKVYHHDANDPHSLPREEIKHIVEDKNGILWINEGFGLGYLNPLTDKFNFYRHDPNNSNSLGSGQSIPFVDSKNNLWVCTDMGLQLFDRECQTFETILLSQADSIKDNQDLGSVWAVVEDKEHKIWCSGRNGIYKFDDLKRELKLFPFQDKSYGAISDIFIDHDGNFWVAYWNSGIGLFHPESGIYEPITPFKTSRFNLFGKMSEWKDPFSVYWLTICTQSGLFFYNCKSGEKAIIQNNPLQPYSLLFNDLYYVYTDQDNILWIGTKKGLNILDNADQVFHSWSVSGENSLMEIPERGHAVTLYEDPDYKMISFMRTKGLGIYDKDWKLIKFYPGIPPSDTSREAREIYSISRDSRDIYWIATDNGLVRCDFNKNSFKVFKPQMNDSANSEDPVAIREILHFDSNSFYLRTRSRGIYRFDIIKEKFVQHLIKDENNPASLPSNDLCGLLKYGENQLIILSRNAGIFIFNPQNNTYEIYDHDPDASIDEAMNNLYFDPSLSENTLWLNSAYGLLKFDLNTRQFELYNSRNGLTSDYLVSNEIDDDGNIWVAHNAGISKLDKLSRTFTNYSENNGLVFQELNHIMKLMADGNIYISNPDRLIYFNPHQFKTNQNIPQVHINSVQVMNEPYNMAIDSVTDNKSMVINYNQDLITVDFSVLNFSHPKENKFYFRLNKDSVWHKLNEGTVNLIRLSPGDYVLHVTGSNDSGVMNQTGDMLYISILPPYYQTWWFRVVLFAGVILILLWIRYIGIKRIKREEYLKTEFNKQLAQAETKALRAQMNPHFIFNCLNSINSFVIDQKHEIASDYLIKFSKLIRLILDNSRSDTISIDKELETLKLYVLLESARFDNKFKCIYHIAEEVNIDTIMIPPMLLQPFVENAIWHGLMQKEGEGTITIEIKKEDEEFLNISITDDGIGREMAAQLKSKSATHKSHGLKVTSQRIEMMNKLNSTGAQVHIIDLKDDQGNATGTRVELIIPF
jgi:ligand-binding sensor domain-containing protein